MSQRLLLVDDEAAFCEVAAELFVNQGITVDTAANIAEARICIAERQYDGTILDLNLPDHDGVDVAMMVREAEPSMPVMFLAAVFDRYESRIQRANIQPFRRETKPLPASDEEFSVLCREVTTQMLNDRFKRLRAIWLMETEFMSSPNQMAMHPAYQKIIGLGTEVVRCLLTDLKEEPQWWFWALKAITRCDPVRPEQRGHIVEMTQAWLDWGRRNGEVS